MKNFNTILTILVILYGLISSGCSSKTGAINEVYKFWQLYYNGKEISLTPSIGNYEFPCQSHYFIRHNRVEWCLPIRSKKKRKKKKWQNLCFWKLL